MILLLLAIVLIALVKFWYIALVALALYGVWLCVRWCMAEQAREDRERLRHARARQEIDAIAFATARAMHEAAARGSDDVIEGTAVEVRR